jgi:hypothetical protein
MTPSRRLQSYGKAGTDSGYPKGFSYCWWHPGSRPYQAGAVATYPKGFSYCWGMPLATLANPPAWAWGAWRRRRAALSGGRRISPLDLP